MIYIQERISCKVPGDTSIFISFQYNKNIVDAVKNIQNSVYNKNSHEWETPISNLSKVLDSLIQYDKIDLTLLNDEIENNVNIELPEFKTAPFDYQLDGIKYGLTHDNFLLLDAPGLGKTLQIIYIAQELKRRENIEHCLIICGVNTLKFNWKNEIEKHSDLSCRILGERYNKSGKLKIGGVQDRIDDLKNPIEEFFIITNIESLRNEDLVKAILKGPNKIDMVAFDEAHHAKSPTAAQTKGLLKIKDPKHKIAMTGTILTNSPLDAYTALKWLGVERSTYTNFKYYYCRFSGPFNNILVGYKNIDYLKDQLEKHGLRRTKDLLSLPEKTIIDEYVDMNDLQEQFYENIKNGIVSEVDKVEMNSMNILSMVGRLRQATACPSILTSESIESSKITRAVDLVEDIINNGDKVVIFSTFKATLDALNEKLKQYKPLLCTGDVKDEIIDENKKLFQENNDYKVLLATHQKLGTGVTLTAASYAIFIDTPWTAADYEQAQDRIHRIGSSKPVFIYNLICKGTIDERVKEIVESKEAISNYIVDNKITSNGLASLRKYIEDL